MSTAKVLTDYNWSPEDSRENPEVKIAVAETQKGDLLIRREYSLPEDLKGILVRTKYYDNGKKIEESIEDYGLAPGQEIKPWVENNHEADFQVEFEEFPTC